MQYLLLIIGLSGLGAFGDVLLKMAGQPGPTRTPLLVLGAAVYLLTVPGWFIVLHKVQLPAVGAIYATSTVLILTITGMFFFHERLTATELIGVGLAIAAVIALRRLV